MYLFVPKRCSHAERYTGDTLRWEREPRGARLLLYVVRQKWIQHLSYKITIIVTQLMSNRVVNILYV